MNKSLTYDELVIMRKSIKYDEVIPLWWGGNSHNILQYATPYKYLLTKDSTYRKAVKEVIVFDPACNYPATYLAGEIGGSTHQGLFLNYWDAYAACRLNPGKKP